MTEQEKQLIEELAKRIQSAPAPQIDRDADDLIRRGIGSRPDALYILTQTVLIQEMALNQAKARIDQLTREAPQASTSFLGSNAPPPHAQAPGNAPPPEGGGRGFGRTQPPSPRAGYQGSSYQTGYNPPPPAQPQPQYYAPGPAAPAGGGGFSGFLHNAAQTAAGIVAGEVAFSAISSLFGHGGGGFFGGGGGVSPVSETIINNYYDEGHDRGSEGRHELDPGLSPDIEDRRFADTGSDDADDTRDDSQADDSQQDDSQQDDSDDNSSDDDSSDDSGDDSSFDDSSYDDGSDSNDV
jgi:hypothetical protein